MTSLTSRQMKMAWCRRPSRIVTLCYTGRKSGVHVGMASGQIPADTKSLRVKMACWERRVLCTRDLLTVNSFSETTDTWLVLCEVSLPCSVNGGMEPEQSDDRLNPCAVTMHNTPQMHLRQRILFVLVDKYRSITKALMLYQSGPCREDYEDYWTPPPSILEVWTARTNGPYCSGHSPAFRQQLENLWRQDP